MRLRYASPMQSIEEQPYVQVRAEYRAEEPLAASARAAGYRPGTPHPKPRPYNGYYFHILTQQGQSTPGGAKDYVVNGHMTGGFALIAYPATYGDSGIMTFIVNQDGIVFQKNLGPNTTRIAAAFTQYDPDGSWQVSQP